jgi:hypothetical protein
LPIFLNLELLFLYFFDFFGFAVKFQSQVPGEGVTEKTAGANPRGLTRGLRSEGGPPAFVRGGGRGNSPAGFTRSPSLHFF